MIAGFLLVAASLLPQVSVARVILTADVNIRRQPSTTADVVCRRSFGDELHVLSREGEWLRVSECGVATFVAASFTRPITDATRLAVREALIRERLQRTSDTFAAADRLAGLTRSWGTAHAFGDDREAAGRYALYHLQALLKAARAADAGFRGYFAQQMGEHSPVLFYNEIGGGWMLRNAHILKVHEEFRDTRAADDIAWFAIENGLGGECEGYVPCYISRADMLFGEYLRRHPAGRHVAAGMRDLAAFLDVVGTDMLATATSKIDSCKDAKQPLTALTAAVRAAQGETSPVLARLEAVANACR